MNRRSISSLAVFLGFISTTGLGTAPAQAPLNTLSAAEKKAGWTLLWDGVDKFAEWKIGENGGANSNSWIIDNGALRSPNLNTMLFSKKTFSNFEWSLEWKLSKGGNSGLFIRVVNPPGWYCSGFEYAILDDESGGDRVEVSKNAADRLSNGKMAYIKRTGSVYDLYPTTRDGMIGGQYYDSTFAKKFDEWNQGVVWANGTFLEHWLNGKKVVDAVIGSTEWTNRYRNSKFYPQCGDQFSLRPSGMLGLQDHGSGLIISIRNVKIRVITPGEKLVSPLVTPAGGTFAGPVKLTLEAAITGSVIRYTLDGSDPTETSPIYKDSLMMVRSATLKSATFRARFPTSDVVTSTFTITGSGILAPARLLPEYPVLGKFFYRLDGKRLNLPILSPEALNLPGYQPIRE